SDYLRLFALGSAGDEFDDVVIGWSTPGAAAGQLSLLLPADLPVGSYELRLLSPPPGSSLPVPIARSEPIWITASTTSTTTTTTTQPTSTTTTTTRSTTTTTTARPTTTTTVRPTTTTQPTTTTTPPPPTTTTTRPPTTTTQPTTTTTTARPTTTTTVPPTTTTQPTTTTTTASTTTTTSSTAHPTTTSTSTTTHAPTTTTLQAMALCEIVGASVCDDGDPCTVDSCVPRGGCVSTPASGFASVTCTCGRSVPAACAGQELPASIGGRRQRGCGLFAAAAGTARRPLVVPRLRRAVQTLSGSIQ